MNFSYRTIYLHLNLLFLIFEVYFCYPVDEFEGSKCKNTDSNGVCKLVTDCLIAKESLKKYRSHNLHRCGFNGDVEIVCCPSSSIRDFDRDDSSEYLPNKKTTTTNKPIENDNRQRDERKCEKVCDEIASKANIVPSFHILEGIKTDLGEFPHMAALGYETDNGTIAWDCGASLISSRYLLTAAHCVINLLGSPTKVRLGSIDIGGNRQNVQDYNIVNTTVNREYNYRTKLHDIALIKIDKDVQFDNNTYPACLYTKTNDPPNMIATGWGATDINERQRSNILLRQTFYPIPIKECGKSYVNYNKPIVESQICAYQNNSDTCKGDSGGPLQVQYKENSVIYSIVGITSYGINCGSKNPSIYTRVSYYLDWIENIVWP